MLRYRMYEHHTDIDIVNLYLKNLAYNPIGRLVTSLNDQI